VSCVYLLLGLILIERSLVLSLLLGDHRSVLLLRLSEAGGNRGLKKQQKGIPPINVLPCSGGNKL
jgi:hypothetical protein